jgi:hypothetical protein
MHEYLAPGVYVEETTFRQKSIEGVSTSTAGFVGPTRFGPTSGEPELLTSFLDFERIYGGIDELSYDVRQHNDLAHAVRGFFENGGRRLYVARTFDHSSEPDDAGTTPEERYPDSGLCVLNKDVSEPEVVLRARWPGAAGNFIVTLDVKVGSNILVQPNGDDPTLSGALRWDTVLVRSAAAASMPLTPTLHVVKRVFDDVLQEERDVLLRDGDEATLPEIVGSGAEEIRVVTLTVTLSELGRFMDPQVWENVNPDPRHSTNSLSRKFAAVPPDRATSLYVPLVIEADALSDGAAIVEALLAGLVTTSPPGAMSVADAIEQALIAPASAPPARSRCRLTGGGDGKRPGTAAYQGDESRTGEKSGLLAFEDLEDISIVAAPGASRGGGNGFAVESESIVQLLISHAERMRYPSPSSTLPTPQSSVKCAATAHSSTRSTPRSTTRGSRSPTRSPRPRSPRRRQDLWQASTRAMTSSGASTRRRRTRSCGSRSTSSSRSTKVTRTC